VLASDLTSMSKGEYQRGPKSRMRWLLASAADLWIRLPPPTIHLLPAFGSTLSVSVAWKAVG
jgi:hypothetical protein